MARGRNRVLRRIVRRTGNQVGNLQLQLLMSYMEQHLLFARGQITRLGPQGHIKYKNMWTFLTNSLNEVGPCIKKEDGWQRYWTKLRLSAKTRKAAFLKDLNRTGHNAPAEDLCETDERISVIYGRFGKRVNIDQELGLHIVSCNESKDSFIQTDESLQFIEEISHLLDVIIDFNRTKGASKPNGSQMTSLIDRLGVPENKKYGSDAGVDNRDEQEEFWADTAIYLNGKDGGCSKPGRGWMKTWFDMVGNARQNLKLREHGIRNIPLTTNHLRVLIIMGDISPNALPAEPLAPMNHVPVQAPARGLPSTNTSRTLADTFGRPAKRPYSSVGQIPMASQSSAAHDDVDNSRIFGPLTGNESAMVRTLRKAFRPTFCGYEQLMSGLNRKQPPTKFARKQVSEEASKNSAEEPQPSTSRVNVTSSKTGEKATKLMSILEQKATECIATLLGRFQETIDLQAVLIMSSMETQIGVLLERLPQLIEDSRNRVLEPIVTQTTEKINQIIQQNMQILLAANGQRNQPQELVRDPQHNEENQQPEFLPNNQERVGQLHVDQQEQIDNPAQDVDQEDIAALLALIERAEHQEAGKLDQAENHAEPVVEQADPQMYAGMDEVDNVEEVVEDCSICFDTLTRPKRLECRHIFCKQCLKKWLQKNKSCPICRHKINRFKMTHE